MSQISFDSNLGKRLSTSSHDVRKKYKTTLKHKDINKNKALKDEYDALILQLSSEIREFCVMKVYRLSDNFNYPFKSSYISELSKLMFDFNYTIKSISDNLTSYGLIISHDSSKPYILSIKLPSESYYGYNNSSEELNIVDPKFGSKLREVYKNLVYQYHQKMLPITTNFCINYVNRVASQGYENCQLRFQSSNIRNVSYLESLVSRLTSVYNLNVKYEKIVGSPDYMLDFNIDIGGHSDTEDDSESFNEDNDNDETTNDKKDEISD